MNATPDAAGDPSRAPDASIDTPEAKGCDCRTTSTGGAGGAGLLAILAAALRLCGRGLGRGARRVLPLGLGAGALRQKK